MTTGELSSQLKTILQQVDQGVVILTLQGDILLMNLAYQKMLGFENNSAISSVSELLKCLSVNDMDDVAIKQDQWPVCRLMRGETFENYLLKVTNVHNSRSIVASYNGSLVKDEAGNVEYLVFLVQDRTKEYYMQLQKIKNSRFETIVRLSGRIAYQYKNLLTVLEGNLDIILQEEDIPSSISPALKQIETALERAALLTENLHILSGQKNLVYQLIQWNVYLEQKLNEIIEMLPENISLELVWDQATCHLNADAEYIKQLLTSLIQYTAAAVPKGGKLSLNAGCTKDETGEWAELRIKDTRTTQNIREQQLLQEPFGFRSESEAVHLDLLLCYCIAKQHGGSLDWVTDPEEGVCIKVKLPCFHKHEPARDSAAAVHEIAKPALKNTSILLVEDEDTVRNMLCEILQNQGYQVYTAVSGKDALTLLADMNATPSLLVTDVIMPGMSGVELAENVKRTLPDIKVLYITGYTYRAFEEQNVKIDESNILSKPFKMTTFIERVHDALGSP